MLKFGDIKLDVPAFQAPLSGYSEHPMRVLARQFGAELTFTGVLLDKIALHNKALGKLRFLPGEGEHPVGAQILGANAETMAKAAARFQEVGYDLIDLNFACPAPKVLRRGRGGALLDKPDTVLDIYRRVRDAVKCPVLAKLRIGADHSEASLQAFWQIVDSLSKENIDALVIHGRTVNQKYREKADWQILKQVKQTYPKMQVLGSGDLHDATTAVEFLRTSGLDGIVFARGAIGNPWIFKEFRALWQGEEMPEGPDITEQGRVMLRHFEMMCQLRDPLKSVRFFRKFATGYCKRHPQRKKVQMAVISAKNKQQLLETIKQYYNV